MSDMCLNHLIPIQLITTRKRCPVSERVRVRITVSQPGRKREVLHFNIVLSH